MQTDKKMEPGRKRSVAVSNSNVTAYPISSSKKSLSFKQYLPYRDLCDVTGVEDSAGCESISGEG